MPAVTAVVRRGEEVLLVRRADNGAVGADHRHPRPGRGARRSPPGRGAGGDRRDISVDRLASVGASPQVTHANGDLGVYLDLTFACTWLGGGARRRRRERRRAVVAARRAPGDGAVLLERIEAAVAEESRPASRLTRPRLAWWAGWRPAWAAIRWPVLTIDQATYDAIVAHAKRDHPDEACGIVAGPEGSDRPERLVEMVNAAGSPTFYEFDSTELLALYKEMWDRRRGAGRRLPLAHRHRGLPEPHRHRPGQRAGRALRAGQHPRARE